MNMRTDNLLKDLGNTCEVAQDQVVQLRFRAKDATTGKLLQFGDDLFYLHGGYGGAFPKVEAPEEGYGVYQPELVLALPTEEFRDALPETGEAVDGQLPDGRSMTFTVAGISQGQIILDGNHPFAGKRLNFDFEILDIRESIEAERSAGFAFDGMFC